jgi:uncharacterized protein (TIGR03000 family)
VTHRRFVCCCCALIASVTLLHVEPAAAGGYVIGICPMFGYRGFYNNGFSMYGPPFPTYGTVPGIYNGSDQHSYDGPGWYVPRRPLTPPGPDGPVMVPMHRADQTPARPQPPPLPPADREEEAPPPRKVADGQETLPPPRKVQQDAVATIEVRLPDATAEVAINGRATQQSGTTRVFESPPLLAGQVFTYDVKARWLSNGRPVNDDRTLAVEGGKRFVVDFTEPLPIGQARSR